MHQYSITMDLCADFSGMVKDWLSQSGIETNKAGQELWYDYFNIQMKTVRPKKRQVFFSKEFVCPPEMQKGLNKLVSKFENGISVVPHLSKDALESSKFDGLLYDWGIYHFHLGDIDPETGYAQRTGPVLFAKIDDKNVYCINIYNHGKNCEPPWARSDLLKIIHNNWPQTIANWKLPDGIELYPEEISAPSDIQYASLRNDGISTAIFVDKGIAYMSPGGGYMSTGHSQEIVRYCQTVHNTLKLNELYVRDNIASLAAQIENITGKPGGNSFHFMLKESDSVFYVAEIQSNTALFKVIF